MAVEGIQPNPDDLLAALRDRETGAVERVYDAFGHRAFSLAFRIVGDHGAAEDAVQEAFVSLWRDADRLDPSRGSLQSLLLTIVHHKAVDRLRRQRGQARINESIELTAVHESLSESDDFAATSVKRSLVQEALNSLPAEQRKAIELAYFGGYTQIEISKIMNVPLGTVKSRIRLALERLRAAISERDASDLPRGR